jgi:hypothetical protein
MIESNAFNSVPRGTVFEAVPCGKVTDTVEIVLIKRRIKNRKLLCREYIYT